MPLRLDLRRAASDKSIIWTALLGVSDLGQCAYAPTPDLRHRRPPRGGPAPRNDGSAQIEVTVLDSLSENAPLTPREHQPPAARVLAVPHSNCPSGIGDLNAVLTTVVAASALTPGDVGEVHRGHLAFPSVPATRTPVGIAP